jgi:hypothetical protein
MLLLLGGWLALFSYATPTQAQTDNSKVLLAQQEVIETLPPLPNLQPVPLSQQPLPQLQPTQPVEVNQYEQNFQLSESVQQYSQNFERYFVYVEGNDTQTLQQVRRIEPSAYVRRFNGRAVIQSGVFNRSSGAQQRIRELESRGIYGARVVRSSNGQEVTSSTASTGYSTNDGSYRRDDPNRYYVVIPAKLEDINTIASQIRQRIGQYDIVFERTKPRGPHVAVGPFPQRSDAEQWNDYLRDLGYGNARVYYGK